MSADFTVDGIPEARELLGELSGQQLQNRVRRGTRAGAGVFRGHIRSEASSRSDLPRTFRKTRTRPHRNPVGTSVSTASPLWTIFEGGAAGHPVGAPGQLLHSQQGEPFFAARGPVNHPGMGARPLTTPIFERYHDDAGEAALDAVFEGLR